MIFPEKCFPCCILLTGQTSFSDYFCFLSNICIVIVCFLGCDVINFEIKSTLGQRKYVCLRLSYYIPTLNFILKNLEKILEELSEKFKVFLGKTTACGCLLKSKRFASFASFNAIEMVKPLI